MTTFFAGQGCNGRRKGCELVNGGDEFPRGRCGLGPLAAQDVPAPRSGGVRHGESDGCWRGAGQAAPSLLVLAGPGGYVSPEAAGRLRKHGFEVRTIPGAGHHVWYGVQLVSAYPRHL